MIKQTDSLDSKSSKLPDFVGLGVQRAATTWLHECLRAHDEVYLPHEKELNYFNRRLDMGIDWYRQKFANDSDKKICGEITPLYFHTASLRLIKETLPNAKVFVILREPISRAYSAYMLLHEVFRGMTFEQACESDRGKFLIECSKYAEPLAEMFELYPPSQRLVLFYDDVKTDPLIFFEQVCHFLEIEVNPKIKSIYQLSNRIMYPKTQALLQKSQLGWALTVLKQSIFGKYLKQISKKQGDRRMYSSGIAPKFRCKLLESFTPDIVRVEDMTGRDLSTWKSI